MSSRQRAVGSRQSAAGSPQSTVRSRQWAGKNNPRRVLFVTGRLAEPALRRVLAATPLPFAYEIAVLRITVAALMTTAWIARHSSSPQVVSRVQSALETVTHAVESSQRIMHNLRPAILEQGLAAALHWIALRFERRSGVECQIRLPRQPLELPPLVPLVAYRTGARAVAPMNAVAGTLQERDIEALPEEAAHGALPEVDQLLERDVAPDGRECTREQGWRR